QAEGGGRPRQGPRRYRPGAGGGAGWQGRAEEVTPEPAFEDFARGYDGGTAQVVWTRLIDDLETPVSAFLKIGHGKPYAFLFESVEGGAFRARYSIITLAPDLVWRCRGDLAEIAEG